MLLLEAYRLAVSGPACTELVAAVLLTSSMIILLFPLERTHQGAVALGKGHGIPHAHCVVTTCTGTTCSSISNMSASTISTGAWKCS
jgi:hypothetical protein